MSNSAVESEYNYGYRLGYQKGWDDCENKHRKFYEYSDGKLRSAIDLLEKADKKIKDAMRGFD